MTAVSPAPPPFDESTHDDKTDCTCETLLKLVPISFGVKTLSYLGLLTIIIERKKSGCLTGPAIDVSSYSNTHVPMQLQG